MPSAAPASTTPVWLDEGTVNPAWEPPSAPPGRTVRPAVVVLAVLLVLVLLLGLVWRLGGFERRTDVLSDVAVGSTIATGPYELRFTEATAQQRTDYENKVTWRVTMVGEGRTTAEESMTPRSTGDDGMFVAKDPRSGETELPYATSFRPGLSTFGGSFTPGLPMQPFSVAFDFAQTYQPGPTVVFVVYDLDFRDTSLLGDQDPEWANANAASRLQLPVRVLAPTTT